MYGCSLVSNSLEWWSIYRVGKKLATSSRFAQNLSDSVDQSVLTVDYTKLVLLYNLTHLMAQNLSAGTFGQPYLVDQIW